MFLNKFTGQFLDTKVINSIYDDLIQIKKYSRNKEEYRNYLVSKRIKDLGNSWILTHKAIDSALFELRYSKMSSYELCKTYNKVAKSIQSYHKELLKLCKQFAKGGK